MPAIRLMRLVVASDARQLCASLRLSSMRPYRPTAIEFFSGLSDERSFRTSPTTAENSSAGRKSRTNAMPCFENGVERVCARAGVEMLCARASDTQQATTIDRLPRIEPRKSRDQLTARRCGTRAKPN